MSRARNREISIFNLSFLDVLANGLGAVVILLLMAFNEASSQLEAGKQADQVQGQFDAAQKENQERRKVLAGLKALVADLKDQDVKDLERVRGLVQEIGEQQTINFMGIQTAKKKILLVLDLSTSMFDKNFGPSSAETLVRLGESIVNTMSSEDCRFNILGFRSPPASSSLQPFPTWRNGQDLHPATPENREEAKASLRAMVKAEDGCGTPTDQALERAFGYQGVDAIILITDGAPNGCNRPNGNEIEAIPEKLEEFLRRVEQLNGGRRIELNCIGLGPVLYRDHRFRDFLRKLVSQNDGMFASY